MIDLSRAARCLVDGLVYHILNRGNGRQKVFCKNQDYKAFIDLIKEVKKHHAIKIFAYCLMPNHFHFVIMPIQGEELSKFMHRLMTTHVRRYHQHRGSCGHIWQNRYKSFIIQKDIHLLTVLRYVEANPVRAGLVISARDWEWSSHRERIGKKTDFLIDKIPIELPKNWSKYVSKPSTEADLITLRQSVNRQTPFGASRWQKEICENYSLKSTIRAPWRPRMKKEKGCLSPFLG